MTTIRIPEEIYTTTMAHLFDAPGEHVAFFLAKWTQARSGPVFLVYDVLLIPDEQLLSDNWFGVEVNLDGITTAINAAVKSESCLIEIHNHGGIMPRFSKTDKEGLESFIQYVWESLPERPYAATVWGDATIYGEYFLPDGHRERIRSIVVVGNRLRQLVSRDDDKEIEPVFDRQLPWFTEHGQRQLGRIRVGVIGCGGTGSQVIQNLAYLGCRDFVLVDNDKADLTNMNRLVTATMADIGTPKVILGRRLIKSIAPSAKVLSLDAQLQSLEALSALKEVDVLFGCVDNDGARLILNELALAFNLPYIDLAVGISADDGSISLAGGRIALVLPTGPCLYCMGEIDAEEAAFFLSSEVEQSQQIARGYVSGMEAHAPSVVSLNALVAAAAVNEFANFVSGVRSINFYSEYDLLGNSRATKSQWLTPLTVEKVSSCALCAIAGIGDDSHIERYARHSIAGPTPGKG